MQKKETGVVNLDTWNTLLSEIKVKNSRTDYFNKGKGGGNLLDIRGKIVKEIAQANRKVEEDKNLNSREDALRIAKKLLMSSNKSIDQIVIELENEPYNDEFKQLIKYELYKESNKAILNNYIKKNLGNSVSLAVGTEKVTAQDIILAFGKGLTIDTGKSTWEGIKGLFKTETWAQMYDVGTIFYKAEHGVGQEKEAAMVLRDMIAQSIADSINAEIDKFNNGDAETKAWYIGRASGEVVILLAGTKGIDKIKYLKFTGEISKLTELCKLFKMGKYAELLKSVEGSSKILYGLGKIVDKWKLIQSVKEAEKLFRELELKGIKFAKKATQWIARTPDKRIVWLEVGNESAGLGHIMIGHSDDFSKWGLNTADQISEFLLKTVSKDTGKVISDSAKIYDVEINGVIKKLKVITGENGYIVTAYPVTP